MLQNADCSCRRLGQTVRSIFVGQAAEDGPTGCPERSVTTIYARNTPQERRFLELGILTVPTEYAAFSPLHLMTEIYTAAETSCCYSNLRRWTFPA